MSVETSKRRKTRPSTDEDSDSRPEGWAVALLPDLAEINPAKPRPDSISPDTPVSFVPMPAVDDRVGAIATPLIRRFIEVRKGYTAFRDGDVIMAKITPCMENGKAAIARGLTNGLGFGSTEFHVLRSLGAVLPEFVYHYIRQESFRSTAEEEMTGSVGQKRVPRKFLELTTLPVAPLAEQQRIVDALEIVLGKLSACSDRLERVPVILRRFRQSVLAAACSGKLTEDWRESSPPEESAEQLLTRIIEERASDSRMRRAKAEPHKLRPQDADEDLPRSWAITSVGQVTRNHDGKRVPLKADDRRNRRGPYAYFGASGVIDSIDAYLFEGEYLLIAEDGANLLSRSTPIAFQANGQFWVNNHAHVVQTYGGVPLAYLELFLNGLDLQHFVTGTAQPKLTQEALNGISVPLPPVREQEEIVRRVGTLFRLADGIERRVVLGRALSDKLTQSHLARAFRGELVPTEAELAAKEGREYETAEELLARVRVVGGHDGKRAAGRRRRKAG